MKQVTLIEQLTGDYFTFYDNYLGTIMRDFEGFEHPQTQVSIQDVSGPYGAFFVNSKSGQRKMSFGGDFVSDDVYTLRRQAHKALRATGVLKLFKFITYDDLELQTEVEVTKFLSPYTHKVHEYMIEMIAPDYRFYSQELITQMMSVSAVTGGFSLPTSIPFSIETGGTTEVEDMNIVTNQGDEVTDPVFTITGPGTNFILENITTGETLTITTTLISGDELVVDVKNRTVVLNGTDNIYSDVSGDFWSLQPGENELRFFVESGNDVAETQLSIAFRYAYGGL